MRKRSEECKLTAPFCKSLLQCNAMVYPLVGSMFAPAGWPDRLIIHPYWTGLIEFKDTDTVIEPHQWERIRQINKVHPYFAFVVRFPLQGQHHYIEYPTGDVDYLYWPFDGSAIEMLKMLQQIKECGGGV